MALRAADLIILAGLLLLAGAAIAPPAERAPARRCAYPVATDARVGGDDAQTRFVMDFSQKVELRAFTLADPYRVVIDLPQVTFNLPPKTGETGRGLVKAFRFGLVMQGGSRIVHRRRPSRCGSTRPSWSTRRRASRRGWWSISRRPTATAS